MTQRVARPMKFAAFISIIISLVVICLRPVKAPLARSRRSGRSGRAMVHPDGARDSGASTALQAMVSVPFVLINAIDATVDNAVNKVNPGEAQTIDWTDSFRGG